MKKFIASIGVLAVVALTLHVPATASAGDSDSTSESGVLATFGAETIDLSVSWGEAKACTTDGETTVCFRTERELDKYVARTSVSATTALGGGGMALLSSCGSSLKLYAGTGYGLPMISLSSQYVFLNLSAYGFDNATSSYKVGACSSVFYDGSSGGGAVYPGNTNAGFVSTSMLGGWDNRVSSVYIG